MKKRIFWGILIFLITITGFFIYTIVLNPKSPKDEVMIESNELSLKVIYSRPSKRGRLIFGNAAENALLPYGKYWRLGANAPTVFECNRDLFFLDKTLKAGRYSMYVFPFKDNWELRLNDRINKSGYKQPAAQSDVLSVSLPALTLNEEIEKLTISFKSLKDTVIMNIAWDNKMVNVPIQKLKN